MENFELENIRRILRDELSRFGSVEKGSLDAQLLNVAQLIINDERPGERAVEVLINTNTASSLTELLAPKPATKTEYRIIYRDSTGSVHTGSLAYPRKLSFDNLEDAVEELDYLRHAAGISGETSKGYFILQREVVE